MSTWLNEVAKSPYLNQEEFFRKLALKDLCEIRSADLLILDTAEASERGGKEVEFGFALGHYQGKLVWIVGAARNVFHHLADKRFDTWEDCVDFLRIYYPTEGGK